MKNFKKVISVVMALAMIISSFTAVSAAKFADVADTANYAEAVEVLKALGVVNGVEQENGTFNFEPEKSVTRAEAVTMIVGALNLADEAKAAAGTSQFGDVNSQAAWAAGYVNVGVANGFISGYDAKTFGPLDNVTYAQLCVMLTQITGYGEYAKNYGGWPTGYTTMAATAGINEGVAVAQDAALTKGQVAMMIWNALQAPMLGIKTYIVGNDEYVQLDGTDGKFKTLFSDKFDGYVATVKITDTPAGGQDTDKVEFDLVKTDWWPEIKDKFPNKTDEEGDSGFTGLSAELAEGVNVNDSLLQEGKLVYVLDEDDEMTAIYFKAAGKTAAKELAADTYYPQDQLHSTKKYSASHLKIRFGSTYYKFEDTIAVYVNGVVAGAIDANAVIEEGDPTLDQQLDWLLTNAKGTVKLVKNGTEEYNTIFVDFYQIAEVSSVSVKEDVTVIKLRDERCLYGAPLSVLTINADEVEEGNVIVTVKRNGEVAALSSLVNGDIVAYATDFTEIDDGKLEDPKFIDIIATNDTISGSVTAIDANDKTTTNDDVYTIGGADYMLTPVQAGDADTDDLTLKNTVDLVLDPFGRIFDTEISGTAAIYGIALDVDKDDNLKVLLDDGSTKTYEVDYKDVAENDEDFDKGDFIDLIQDEETEVDERVIKFVVSGRTGEIVELYALDGNDIIEKEYKTRTGLLGSGNKILDSTPIIRVADEVEDYTDAAEYSVVTKDDLVDGTKYWGLSYNVNKTTLGFVVITKVGTSFGEDSRFAVAIDEPAEILTEEGDTVMSVKVLYEGEEQDLIFTTAAADDIDLDKIEAGLPFFFETDSDGYVKTIYEYDFETSLASKIDSDDWSFDIWDDNKSIQMAKAVVVDVTSSAISFASYDHIFGGSDVTLDTTKDLDEEVAKEGEAYNEDGIVTYAIADDCVAYTLDTASKSTKTYEWFDCVSASSINESEFSSFDGNNLDEDDEPILKDGIFKGDLKSEAVVAHAMIVDGEIVAIFVIE